MINERDWQKPFDGIDQFFQKCYSLWSIILATLFSVTGGFGSAIHVEYMDFVPELGWQFWSLNL